VLRDHFHWFKDESYGGEVRLGSSVLRGLEGRWPNNEGFGSHFFFRNENPS
jgi:hypothetical protein